MTLRRSIPFWTKKVGGGGEGIGFDDVYLAFGLRKLVRDYTGFAVRVRRSSDSAELDIGFVGEEIDEAAISAFCGIGDTGFLTRIYIQTLNTFSITNQYLYPATATQARIFSIPLHGGDGFIRNSGKIYLTSNGGYYKSDTFDLALFETFFTDNCLVSTVFRTESAASGKAIIEEVQVSNPSLRVVKYQDTTASKYILNARPSGADSFLAMTSLLSTNQYLISSIHKNTSNQYEGYYNGVLEATSAVDTRVFAANTAITLFRQLVGGVVFNSLWAETVIFKNPASGVVTSVIDNQKTYYTL